MPISNFVRIAAVTSCTVAALFAASTPLAAQGASASNAPAAPAPVELASFTCRTLLLASGSERDGVILFMHGYVSGKKGDSSVVLEELAAESDRILEDCIGSPDDKLVDAFMKARR